MVVRDGHVDQDGVERHDAALEEERDLREEDRDVLRAAFVDRLAGVLADEQGLVMEVADHLRREVGVRSLGVHMDDLHVLEFGRALHERLEEDFGRGSGALHEDLLTGLDP